MASTSTQSNNAAVKFRGQTEREMPMELRAMNAAMHSAAEGKSTIGIPKKVGQKFVKESRGQKIKKLPLHVHNHAKRMVKTGAISEKAMKRMAGED